MAPYNPRSSFTGTLSVLDPNKPVRVFHNWKHGCFGVMQGGILRMSVREVLLSDVQFIVRSSGRRRMQSTGVKNVHAYAQGRLVDCVHPDDARTLGRLVGRAGAYNAFGPETFFDANSQAPLLKADLVQLDRIGITYADNPDCLEEPTLAA